MLRKVSKKMSVDRCVCCGEIVPEGSHVCSNCYRNKEEQLKMNDPDPIVTIRAALVCTTTQDIYSAGFRNGLRFAIAVLTGKEPKYENTHKYKKPVKPEFLPDGKFGCPDCKSIIKLGNPYCWNCGRQVIWE